MNTTTFSRIPLLLLACLLILALNGCSDAKPNLDDPVAVAEYLCEQNNDAQQKSADRDTEGAMEILMEIQAFEMELREHHGDAFGEFNSKMEREMGTRCLQKGAE